MDMDVKFHIHGNAEYLTACNSPTHQECIEFSGINWPRSDNKSNNVYTVHRCALVTYVHYCEHMKAG